ncbi:MAG: glutamate--tRNA ligase [Candidatus Babeliales bacterium]
MNKKVRVRFAPAPTGTMHLGNIRTALINFIFAHQKNGTFILRIEDTDPERNFDPGGAAIIEDLKWLDLMYDEGPGIGGPYAPYLQSERTVLYEEKLKSLQQKNLVYRCFCTQEELEKKRQRQRALKLPPRYDRTCLALTKEEIDHLLTQKKLFIWRFKLDHHQAIEITDLAHGIIRFELNNFSDFPLTRQNGSFTYLFANFVDDMTMHITHVFRGEDHLSNTAVQAALFYAFNIPLPIYWHMPILCNTDGKKLSKRDFGFSLQDLKEAGFTSDAINNYLAIIGGSFEKEIMSLATMIKTFNFDHLHTTGHITYDVEKLKWVNRKWIAQYKPEELLQQCRPLLDAVYPLAQKINDQKLSDLLQIIKTDMTTLNDCIILLAFYFTKPSLSSGDITACISKENIAPIAHIIKDNFSFLSDGTTFANKLKQTAKKENVPLKELFWFVRLALMGTTKGPGIHELVSMLGTQEATQRIKHALIILDEEI